MSLIVAIDAGTTGVRAVAIRPDSSVASLSYREFPQYFPQPGWVEHDANEIWEAIVEVIAELANNIDEPVEAIGITNQRETVVAWNRKTGEPVHRAIVWQDRRTTARCAELEDSGVAEFVTKKTGLRLDPYFSATKYAWLLEQGRVSPSPDLALGTIDSWLISKLTSQRMHVTEASNASRTLLFDIEKLRWDPELCDLFGVPLPVLPEVCPSSARFGETTNTTALGAGIPISGVAGDQQSALFGQACFTPGMAKNSYGTGSFLLMNTGPKNPTHVEGLLRTVAWTLGDPMNATYAYEGSVFVTGAAIQWLRDGLGIIEKAADLGPLAASVESTGDAQFVPAFTGLGTPWWDPKARGTIVGITRGTGRAELARATVEAIAYQVRGVADAMTGAGGLDLNELRVDGGASAMELLIQLQADQLGVPVVRSANQETTVLGAAYLAGLAEGTWSSTEEIASAWRSDLRMEPLVPKPEADAKYERWMQAAERSLYWAAE